MIENKEQFKEFRVNNAKEKGISKEMIIAYCTTKL